MTRNFKMKLQELQFDGEVLGSMTRACLTPYHKALDYASTFSCLSYSSLSIKRHFKLKFYLRCHSLFLSYFNESHSLLISKLVLVSLKGQYFDNLKISHAEFLCQEISTYKLEKEFLLKPNQTVASFTGGGGRGGEKMKD